MKIPFSKIDAVIFDLGGVLLNIDYSYTMDAFKNLGMTNVEEVFEKHQTDSFFNQLEIGAISPDIFRGKVREFLPSAVSDLEIDAAWNALLLDFPPERMEFLKEVSSKKRIFLLSNTNAIHMDWFIPKMKEWFGEDVFFSLFEKTYLSHEVKMRKPNVEIFEWVLQTSKLNKETTLFIDDSKEHIEGAKKSGIHTFWLEPGVEVVKELALLLA